MVSMSLSTFLNTSQKYSTGITIIPDGLADSLKIIASFFSYIMHPSKIIWSLWIWLVQSSYFICLFICLGAILIYIFGFKKYAKFVPLSIGIYALIQAINIALKG